MSIDSQFRRDAQDVLAVKRRHARNIRNNLNHLFNHTFPDTRLVDIINNIYIYDSA